MSLEDLHEQEKYTATLPLSDGTTKTYYAR